MQKFLFQLESLLKYRRNQRDLCRQLLGNVLADDHKLATQKQTLLESRNDLLDELRNFSQTGGVDVWRSASRRYHAGQLLGDVRVVERNQELVREQLQLCRQVLTKADQEVKVLEKLRERRRAEFLYEQERRTTFEVEDAWLATNAKEFTK